LHQTANLSGFDPTISKTNEDLLFKLIELGDLIDLYELDIAQLEDLKLRRQDLVGVVHSQTLDSEV